MRTILITGLLCILTLESDGSQDAIRLYNTLTQRPDYDPHARPAVYPEDSVLLYMNLSLIQIIDVDEKNQIISLRVWVNQEWNDPNFIWDPKEYGNISELYIPSKDIWTPDLVLYNNAGGDWDLASSSNTKLVVKSDGSVYWRPPIIFKSQCEIDVEYFPFDKQNCSLKIGTWTHDGDVIDLRHTAQKSNPLDSFDNCERQFDYAIDLTYYLGDVEWDLLAVTAKRNIAFYPCCVNPFLDIRYFIILRRKILFYGVNLICPCLAISFLTLLVFYLPADSNEKISLSINVLISLTVFFLLIFENSPPTSLVVPLILKYLLFTMILITLSVLMTIIVLNIHWRSPETHGLSNWVRSVFTLTLPKLLFMPKPELPENEEVPHSNTDAPYDSNMNIFDSEEENLALTFPKWRRRRQAVAGESMISEIQLALEGCRKIVNHIQKKDKYQTMRDDWKYVALVLDRLFLWIFSIAAIIGMLGIFMQSPTLTDRTIPLTSTNRPSSESINVTTLSCATNIS